MSKLSRHIQIRVGKKQGKVLDKIAHKNGLRTAVYIREVLYKLISKEE